MVTIVFTVFTIPNINGDTSYISDNSIWQASLPLSVAMPKLLSSTPGVGVNAFTRV